MRGDALASRFAAAIERLGPFEPAPLLAVAVSGGADSLALALLADRWARARGGSVVGFVVDHALRPASRAEADLTIERLSRRGIPARLLPITGLARGPGLAARARTARYRVLIGACAELGCLHLLLGHHSADQGETLMMRALGNSGSAGLAGMPALSERATVRLLRPLLAVSRADLRALLRSEGLAWVEDPSNQDPAALRARLRTARGAGAVPGMLVSGEPGLDGPGLDGPGLDGPGLDGPGLDGPGLDGPGLDGPGWGGAASVGRTPAEDGAAPVPATAAGSGLAEPAAAECRLVGAAAVAGRARADAETRAARVLAARVSLYPEGFALMPPGRMHPDALAALIQMLAGAPFPPAAEAVARLAADPRPATLAGVRIMPAGRFGAGWLVLREAASMQPDIAARPGAIWDGRFRLDGPAPPGARLGALGADAARFRSRTGLPTAILRTLPALRHGLKLVAVPHLTYCVNDCAHPSVLLCPPRPIAGAPFWPALSSRESCG